MNCSGTDFDSEINDRYPCSIMPLALDDLLKPGAPGPRRAGPGLRTKEPIGRFTRLAEVASNPGDELELEVEVTYAEGGWPRLDGRVRGTVILTCQRCLGPLSEALDLTLRLALVPEGGGEAVPEGYESWEMPPDGEAPRLRTLIEDEVLLALPLIARHAERAACGELSPLLSETAAGDSPGSETEEGEKGNRPFAILKGLKRTD
jgi:uncharacterized protein